MTRKTEQAMSMTMQALGITSQLLAIGIEIGIIAGGFYIYKNVIKPETKTEQTIPENGMVLVPAPFETKPTFKEKWQKAMKIVKAVVG